MKKTHTRFLLIFLCAFIAFMLGLFISQHRRTTLEDHFHGTLLKQARQVSAFSLTGMDGVAFNNERLQGQWTMMFFGFTHCGYLCPTTMAELAKMYRFLEEKNIQPLPRIVMVSIDPEQDTLDILNHYVTAFNANFYAARGEKDRVKNMSTEMGIAYEKVNNSDIQHSGAVLLFNPNGQLIAFFTPPHQAALLAKDFELLVS